jgi:hypothetical protein
MKKWILIALGSFLIFQIQGCKKFKKYTEFDVNNTSNFTIPSSNYFINLPFDFTTLESTTNIQERIDNEGSSSKLIDRVTLTKLTLLINNPTNGNFDFLNSVEIYLSSNNLPEILAAWQYDIPENSSRALDLSTGNTNLKEYMKESNLTLRVKIVTDKVVPYNIDVIATETFHVKCKLKNLFNK